MKIFGLTGGFATGKSTVCRMFRSLGLHQIDADTLVHQLMTPPHPVWQQILNLFGEEILRKDMGIDRQKLGFIVFNDPDKRKQLEKIIHPVVREAIHREIQTLKQKGESRVLLEIPLLFEVDWHKEEPLDAIIVVVADEKTQLARAEKKLGLDKKEIQARIQAQLPLAEKIKGADYIIDNSKSLKQTQIQVEAIYKKLTS